MMKYAELLARTDVPAGSAWGLHGSDDEVGTLNFLSAEALIAAARLIRKGRVFNLDRPLNAFRLPYRPALKHVILGGKQHHTRDDYVDSFYLQSGTQIDGLRHVKHPVHGFYNGATDEDVVVDTARLGIQRYADRGIAGRGVLLDVDAHLREQGKPLNQEVGDAFTVELLDEVAEAQKVRFAPGDILLIRTGWLHAYFHEMSDDHRANLAKRMVAPGMIQAHETLAWLWDHRFALCAADNPGLEVMPAHPSSPFAALLAGCPEIKSHAAAMMHPILIPLLGLCIGELWDLDALAEDCREDRVYEFMVTAKPLNLLGGVGSPANAMAIK
jgi:kynurenine formamidase